MKQKPMVYLVGGAIRNRLLGLPAADNDYVLVGFSEQDMNLPCYQKIGKDFPVYKHIETGHEYALARKERSTAPGYNDFDVSTEDVTIEEDLFRRDLTINAMAQSHEGVIIDPYNGQEDLKKKTLRHVSVHFKEDPLRVLRLARFRAQFGPLWKIAPETKLMAQSMGQSLLFLKKERVYKEVERVMSSPNSWLFFVTLDELNVLGCIFPHIADLKTYREGSKWHQEPNVFEHTMAMLKLADHEPATVKYMILYHDICKPYCYRHYGNGAGHDSALLAEPRIDMALDGKTMRYVLTHIEYHQRIFKIFDGMGHKKIYSLIRALKKDKTLLDYMLRVSEYDKKGSISLVEHRDKDFTSFVSLFNTINAYSPLNWIGQQEIQPSGEQIQQHKRMHAYSLIKIFLKELEDEKTSNN